MGFKDRRRAQAAVLPIVPTTVGGWNLVSREKEMFCTLHFLLAK